MEPTLDLNGRDGPPRPDKAPGPDLSACVRNADSIRKVARGAVHVQDCDVDDIKVTSADLLEAWREATRAAALAERLARLALETAEQADRDVTATEGIATLAERAAEALEAAAKSARAAATDVADRARVNREMGVAEADQTLVQARGTEVEARDAYQRAERDG
jgi:hypothetical protein